MDLTGVARVLIADTFRTFEIWIVVGLIYLALSYAMLYGLKPGIPAVRPSARRSGGRAGAAPARLAPAAGAGAGQRARDP